MSTLTGYEISTTHKVSSAILNEARDYLRDVMRHANSHESMSPLDFELLLIISFQVRRALDGIVLDIAKFPTIFL